jgi:hypothetical protein
LEQKAKRVIVEIVFGNIKTWEVAKLVYCGSPEMQTMALMVVYQLVWSLVEKAKAFTTM